MNNGIYLATAAVMNASSGLGKVLDTLSNWMIAIVAAIFLVRIFMKVFKMTKGDSVKIGDLVKDVIFALIIIFIILLLKALMFGTGPLQKLLEIFGGKANTIINNAGNIIN